MIPHCGCKQRPRPAPTADFSEPTGSKYAAHRASYRRTPQIAANLLYSCPLTFKSEVHMRKMTVPLACAAAAAFITVAVMSIASGPVSFYAQARQVSSYAEDRAAIEDLQAVYLFAVDFHDP